MRADIGGDPKEPWLKIAWKYLYTSKDTWLGAEQNLGCCGSVYNLTMDPYEKYDMLFNGAVSTRLPTTSPGRYAGEDNGWVLSLTYPGCRCRWQDRRGVSKPQADQHRQG